MFSSPIGESTFSTNESSKEEHGRNEFSSPIGESTFSTMTQSAKKNTKASFRPLSGNLLSLRNQGRMHDVRCGSFSSPIGESTFSTNTEKFNPFTQECFRPLSGNLLSLPKKEMQETIEVKVFVPYRGIYFLYPKMRMHSLRTCIAFSSPIGESTFSTFCKPVHYKGNFGFSSPIGESTFSTPPCVCKPWRGRLFSSPIGESTFSTTIR